MEANPDPTPEEIRQRSLEVQKTWSKNMEVKRRVWSDYEAETQTISLSDLAAARQ